MLIEFVWFSRKSVGIKLEVEGKRVLFYGKRISQSNSKCSITDTNIRYFFQQQELNRQQRRLIVAQMSYLTRSRLMTSILNQRALWSLFMLQNFLYGINWIPLQSQLVCPRRKAASLRNGRTPCCCMQQQGQPYVQLKTNEVNWYHD